MSRRPGAHGAHASASEKERVNSIFKADGTTQYLLDMREFSSDGAPAISSWLVRSLGHKYATIEPTQDSRVSMQFSQLRISFTSLLAAYVLVPNQQYQSTNQQESRLHLVFTW